MTGSLLIYGVGSGLFSFAAVEEPTQEEVQTKGKIYYLYNLGEVIHVEQDLYRLKNEFSHWATTIPQGEHGSEGPEQETGRS